MSATGTEARVCALIAERQKLGISKYGTTVEDNPLGMIQWLKHLRDELLDGAIYAQRAIEQLEGVEAEPLSWPTVASFESHLRRVEQEVRNRRAVDMLNNTPEPVVTKEEKEALNDPHAELRKTWRAGQLWESRKIGGDWYPVQNPLWSADQEYRRSPECTWIDPDQEKPWYPDDSGEWVEVPDDLMEMPNGLERHQWIERLFHAEREEKDYFKVPIWACGASWASPIGSKCRIVAYKVFKP